MASRNTCINRILRHSDIWGTGITAPFFTVILSTRLYFTALAMELLQCSTKLSMYEVFMHCWTHGDQLHLWNNAISITCTGMKVIVIHQRNTSTRHFHSRGLNGYFFQYVDTNYTFPMTHLTYFRVVLSFKRNIKETLFICSAPNNSMDIHSL